MKGLFMEIFDKISVREAHIQNLLFIGYVTGILDIDNISESHLYLDKKNYRVIILNKYDKNLNNYSYDYASNYNINCITDFKYERCDIQKFNNQTVVRDYFKLMVSDNHCIDFYIEKSYLNSESEKNLKLIDNDIRLRINLIFAFIHLIEDEATISWVNEFCVNSDILPLFYETGEVSVYNMKENARLINI